MTNNTIYLFGCLSRLLSPLGVADGPNFRERRSAKVLLFQKLSVVLCSQLSNGSDVCINAQSPDSPTDVQGINRCRVRQLATDFRLDRTLELLLQLYCLFPIGVFLCFYSPLLLATPCRAALRAKILSLIGRNIGTLTSLVGAPSGWVLDDPKLSEGGDSARGKLQGNHRVHIRQRYHISVMGVAA